MFRLIVRLDPRLVLPPPLSPVPVFMVTALLLSFSLVIVGMRARLSVPLVILAAGMIPLVSSP